MSGRPVVVAVVGHTNTGKTSLMRTLTRDVDFGEVSDRPAVTTEVEGAQLLSEGEPLLALYDTPGLEDSIRLLEHLDGLAGATGPTRRRDWFEIIDAFLRSPETHDRFSQEAKALGQVLASDIVLYVIDAREPVVGKYGDELEILSRCARPVVPVLNFTAADQAQTAVWRERLARLNLHAVAEFDTVVFDEDDERRLYEKLQTLLDQRREIFDRLIDERRRQRRRLVRAASRMLADLLIDVAAYVTTAPSADRRATDAATEAMKEAIRQREQRCLAQLLELLRFRSGDSRLAELAVVEGRWGLDLFSPAALRQFGVRASGTAAAGAVAGLAVDALMGGITFGVFAASGAALGALWETGQAYGHRLMERARGWQELRCSDRTLLLLFRRQLALVSALLRRGHAAIEPVVVGGDGLDAAAPALPDDVERARANPRWSSLEPGAHAGAPLGLDDPERDAVADALATRIETALDGLTARR